MSNPALSFLYHTRTILRQPHASTHQLPRKSFTSSTSRCLRRRPGRPPTLDRDAQADVAPGFDPNSTLTPTENLKFRAIFEAAAKGLPPPSLQRSSDRDAQSTEEEVYKLGKSLDTIFEQSTSQPDNAGSLAPSKEVRTSTVSSARKAAAPVALRDLSPEFPAALQGAWRDVRRAMAVDNRQTSNETSIENEVFKNHVFRATEDNTHKQRAEDIAKMRDLFQKAESDAAVWDILENAIFPRITKLVQIVKARLLKPGKKKAATGDGLKATPNSQKSESVAAVIQSTYAIHLLNAMRTFRTRFPRSPYALALIPAVKKLDSVSQILGLSTQLYNELLYMAWRQHSDIFECARIVEDMDSQGLVGDMFTSAVFIDAEREMLAAQNSAEQLSVVRGAWWQLTSVRDAMKRWQVAMDALDTRAEEERRYREQWETEQSELEDDTIESASKSSKHYLHRCGFYNDDETVARAAPTLP